MIATVCPLTSTPPSSSAASDAAPDGSSRGLITVEITMLHHQKLTELSATSYPPIALVNLDPAGFQVRAAACSAVSCGLPANSRASQFIAGNPATAWSAACAPDGRLP